MIFSYLFISLGFIDHFINCHVFQVGTYFQSGMVLQSGMSNIWGWGETGSTVVVSINSTSLAAARVDYLGKWLLSVNLTDGGPFNLTFVHKYGVIPQILNLPVFVGEVWLCVGSDNMALPMSQVSNSAHEISSSF